MFAKPLVVQRARSCCLICKINPFSFLFCHVIHFFIFFFCGTCHLELLQLQIRMLQSCPYLQNSSFSIGQKYEKCFQIRFRKLKACVIKGNQPRVITEGNYTSRNSDGCRWAITSQPQFKFAYSSIMMPLNHAGVRIDVT